MSTVREKPKKQAARSAVRNHEYRSEATRKQPPSEAERTQSFGEPWRAQRLIEGNPIGLSEETVAALLPLLDALQATMWTMYHQYHKHHWLVEGPQFHDLHLFFENHYNEVHDDIDTLAERMTALGGIPTCDPSNQEALSHVRHEPEGTFRIRAMLRHDLQAEGALARALRAAVDTAAEHHEHGTKRILESVLVRAEERAHHLDHFLGEDTLELGLTADDVRE